MLYLQLCRNRFKQLQLFAISAFIPKEVHILIRIRTVWMMRMLSFHSFFKTSRRAPFYEFGWQFKQRTCFVQLLLHVFKYIAWELPFETSLLSVRKVISSHSNLVFSHETNVAESIDRCEQLRATYFICLRCLIRLKKKWEKSIELRRIAQQQYIQWK